MARLVEHAPAKVNLTLAVLGRRADGYHLLDSLVVFADAGDRLTLTPGGPLALHVRGVTAKQAGPVESNLVFKAAKALAGEIPNLKLGLFTLDKRLPCETAQRICHFRAAHSHESGWLAWITGVTCSSR
jgi:4-diphosphocytidyl-2-C-methyl-D-erythritol kinase